MTVYQCSVCSKPHWTDQPACPQTFTLELQQTAATPLLRICDHCGDTVLVDDECPVCSQQVSYTVKGLPTFPLAIIRGGTWRTVSQRGRSAGPRGKWLTCAVVAESDKGQRGEYLTACGDVVERGTNSVWAHAPTCPACRRSLRKNANE